MVSEKPVKIKNLLITGGAGFIGSHYVKLAIKSHPGARITVLDKLTYAGNLENLKEVWSRIRFVKGDIADPRAVRPLFKDLDAVVHFAAETHVDRSIGQPDAFLRTNVFGTYTLLEAAREARLARFVHVSTDEVYGSAPAGKFFRETDRLNPSSPYSSSKAASDLLALSYHTTFGLPVLVTRCTNNYGPNQYPEKVIPLFTTNLVEGKRVPVYGSGKNRRDWIYVGDHCRGVDLVLKKGVAGEIYNIAGEAEMDNLALTRNLLEGLASLDKAGDYRPESRIEFVQDRPGHDFRYAIDCGKIKKIGYRPQETFSSGIRKTVAWYRENAWWWKPLKARKLAHYRGHYAKK
jgi:dTDP-glucose 4,6-dehydratase